MNARTFIQERADDELVEYRLSDASIATVMRIEARVLQRNGHPHDDRWYPVSDEGWVCLVNSGSDILALLRDEHTARFGN
jgi:DNA-binding transcriptional regulator PaaX